VGTRPNSIIVVLFVGITEEMVFRCWLLNATVKKKYAAMGGNPYKRSIVFGNSFPALDTGRYIHKHICFF